MNLYINSKIELKNTKYTKIANINKIINLETIFRKK